MTDRKAWQIIRRVCRYKGKLDDLYQQRCALSKYTCRKNKCPFLNKPTGDTAND